MWGTGSVERRNGAGGIARATGLSLVEGPFQLPPPLDPTALLAEVVEDLLCGSERTETWSKKNKKNTRNIKPGVYRQTSTPTAAACIGVNCVQK